MKKLFIYAVFFAAALTIPGHSMNAQVPQATPVVKQAREVFKKWLEWQRLLPECNISSLKTTIDDSFAASFKKYYESKLLLLRSYSPFLQEVTGGKINEYGHQLGGPLPHEFKQAIGLIYDLIQYNMTDFIDLIKSMPFLSASTRTGNVEKQTEEYLALIGLLFPQENQQLEKGIAFSVAHNFFRFCFSDETFPQFERMMLNKDDQEIVKFLYTVIWYHLAGNGWKNWSTESLRSLKEAAQQKKKITYIAGGSDIYQIIKECGGACDIINIDPQLPSQPKYYTNEWEWLLSSNGPNGGYGEKILFDEGFFMQRTGCQGLGQTFQARLANGQVINIEKSETHWDIFSSAGEQIGSYTLKRRFVEQDDFKVSSDKVFLISFNELFFIASPALLGGWGIEPGKFDPSFKIHVKQLPRTVSKSEINNMRVAALLNNTDLRYISLGTCIN